MKSTAQILSYLKEGNSCEYKCNNCEYQNNFIKFDFGRSFERASSFLALLTHDSVGSSEIHCKFTKSITNL